LLVVASSPSLKRTRGPNKRPPWKRRPEDGLSVLRLPLEVTDPVQRARVEAMFDGAFSVRRAVQRRARKRARAYWSATSERARDPAASRERLGLSREAFERHAREQLDAAPHLRRAVTKAQAMHLADSVWTAMERHLFRDASGKTHGMPRPSRWFDFTRLPGRARSHTKDRKWETFRLHGSLSGHRATYTGADGRFFQPRRMRPIEPATSWWSYDGPLVVVFSGLPIGTVILPVRLPSAPSNQPILDHHLGDPSRWHKIDLVRSRDPNAAGGWRYEAHLSVLVDLYVSPAVHARREVAAIDTAGRRAGIDVNVSNVTVASHAEGEELKITRIGRDATQRMRDRSRAKRERRRQRALDRSRRAMNRDQYALSKRQEKRERRRAGVGRRPVEVIPTGPRKTFANGKPAQGYWRDQLSNRYRHERAAQAADAAAQAQARRDAARRTAGELVRAHGTSFVVEDCDVSAWSRHWGRSLAAFAPAMLVTALEREAQAVARGAGATGGVLRAATRTTALSQHCLCSSRVSKSLADRVHDCWTCGLVGDRDAVAAVLAAHVVLATPDQPSSARVDFTACQITLARSHTRAALRDTVEASFKGWQDVPSESTASSARDGSFITWGTRPPDPVVVARRIVGWASYPAPDEIGIRYRTTPERARMRANLPWNRELRLRDSS
jgi:transposase